MRSIAIAEWILSLTFSRERAATTAGDLVEESLHRSTPWFWVSVLRTTLSHLTEVLLASPMSMLGLSLWTLLQIWVGFALLISGAGYAGSLAWRWFGLAVRIDPNGGIQPFPDPQSTFLKILIEAAMPLIVGWVLARRSSGRELPAAFAANFVLLALHCFAMWASAHQIQQMGLPWPGVENVILPMELLQRMGLLTIAAWIYRVRSCVQSKRQLS